MRRYIQLMCPLAVGLIVLVLGPGSPRPPMPAPDAMVQPVAEQMAGQYVQRNIDGWTVLINKELLARQPELADRTLNLLHVKLFDASRKVPEAALRKLRMIRIWVEENEPHHPCMAYHKDPDWLLRNGMNPEKAGCVEIANARNFLKWTLNQPWMVLHELSHGYHHQFLPGGAQNREIMAAYEHAMRARLYDSVLRWNGREEKAYAASSPMEYFAEATEAFFGVNDYFPFVRSELQRYDPRAHNLLEKVWGVAPAEAN
jgi:hypothetical protein